MFFLSSINLKQKAKTLKNKTNALLKSNCSKLSLIKKNFIENLLDKKKKHDLEILLNAILQNLQ